MGYDIFGDVKATKMVQILNIASVLIHKDAFEPLNRPLRASRKSYIEEALKLELKAQPSLLKYDFLGDDDTLRVILSIGLSVLQVEEALVIVKRRKKAIGW